MGEGDDDVESPKVALSILSSSQSSADLIRVEIITPPLSAVACVCAGQWSGGQLGSGVAQYTWEVSRDWTTTQSSALSPLTALTRMDGLARGYDAGNRSKTRSSTGQPQALVNWLFQLIFHNKELVQTSPIVGGSLDENGVSVKLGPLLARTVEHAQLCHLGSCPGRTSAPTQTIADTREMRRKIPRTTSSQLLIHLLQLKRLASRLFFCLCGVSALVVGGRLFRNYLRNDSGKNAKCRKARKKMRINCVPVFCGQCPDHVSVELSFLFVTKRSCVRCGWLGPFLYKSSSNTSQHIEHNG